MGIINIPGYSLLLLKRCLDFCQCSYNGEDTFKGGNMLFKGTQHDVFVPIYYGYQYGKDLYLIIRGTVDDIDFETDCSYRQLKTQIGTHEIYTHGGFLKGADYILEQTKSLLESYTDGNIYITGHSMGASMATILGLKLLSDSAFAGKQIGILAFAPAPCVSEVPAEYLDKLVNIVNDKDLIPEFSAASIYNIIEPIIPETTTSKPVVKAVLLGVINIIKLIKTDFSDKMYIALTEAVPELVDDLYDYKRDKSTLKVNTLHGVTYKIKKGGPTELSQCEIDPTTLNIMIFDPASFNAHMPYVYAAVLDEITSL